MRTVLAILLCTFLGGCVVVPSHHPHGGPPGQMKKSHARHDHGGRCGHKRKLHKGRYLYFVGGRWCTDDGIVVIVRS